LPAAFSPFAGVASKGIGCRQSSGFVDFLEIAGDFTKSFFLNGLNQEKVGAQNC
jgi:hypothetical protein